MCHTLPATPKNPDNAEVDWLRRELTWNRERADKWGIRALESKRRAERAEARVAELERTIAAYTVEDMGNDPLGDHHGRNH